MYECTWEISFILWIFQWLASLDTCYMKNVYTYDDICIIIWILNIHTTYITIYFYWTNKWNDSCKYIYKKHSRSLFFICVYLYTLYIHRIQMNIQFMHSKYVFSFALLIIFTTFARTFMWVSFTLYIVSIESLSGLTLRIEILNIMSNYGKEKRNSIYTIQYFQLLSRWLVINTVICATFLLSTLTGSIFQYLLSFAYFYFFIYWARFFLFDVFYLCF